MLKEEKSICLHFHQMYVKEVLIIKTIHAYEPTCKIVCPTNQSVSACISTLITLLVTLFSVHTCCPQINAHYLLFHSFLVLSLSTTSMLGFHNKRDLTAQFALSSPLSHCPGSLLFSCPICLLYLAFFINPPKSSPASL